MTFKIVRPGDPFNDAVLVCDNCESLVLDLLQYDNLADVVSKALSHRCEGEDRDAARSIIDRTPLELLLEFRLRQQMAKNERLEAALAAPLDDQSTAAAIWREGVWAALNRQDNGKDRYREWADGEAALLERCHQPYNRPSPRS